MASEKITAIDIGTNSIKVAQFEKETDISLVNLGIANYPRESAAEEIDDEVITNTLKNILDHKIKTKSVVLSIPRELVTSRKMTNFPITATDDQIKGMVETQAETELPFGTSETVFDYHNLRRTEEQISVDLVAAKRDTVERYVNILKQLEIDPIAILPSTYASSALAMSQVENGENHDMIMIVDIGAGRTDLSIFRSEHILFNRSIPLGGNNLTRRYEIEAGLTFEDAEERKRVVASLVKETPAVELTREWADDLVVELNRSIQATTRNLLDKNVRPDDLWLCGGSCQIPGLGQYISERLEIPLTEWNPFEAIPNIQLPSGIVNEVSGMYNRFAVVLGLGVNAFDKRIDLNLVLPEIVRKKEQSIRRRKTIRYAIAAAALIVMMIVGAISWGQYRQSKLEFVVEQLKQYKEAKTEALNSLTQDLVMMDMLGDRVSILDILKELTERLPKRTDVALTTFKVNRLDDLNRASLTVNAETSSYENISQLISRIGNSEIFTDVKPGQVTFTERDRKQVFMVQIKCGIASNAVELIASAKERSMSQPSEELAVAKAEETSSQRMEGRMPPGRRFDRSERSKDTPGSEHLLPSGSRKSGRQKRKADRREAERSEMEESEMQEEMDIDLEEFRDEAEAERGNVIIIDKDKIRNRAR